MRTLALAALLLSFGAGVAIAAPAPDSCGWVVVGSGKFVSPWARMHSDSCSIIFFCEADACPVKGPPGNSLAQSF